MEKDKSQRTAVGTIRCPLTFSANYNKYPPAAEPGDIYSLVLVIPALPYGTLSYPF